MVKIGSLAPSFYFSAPVPSKKSFWSILLMSSQEGGHFKILVQNGPRQCGENIYPHLV